MWNVYSASSKNGTKVLIREETEYLPTGFSYVREATYSEWEDEQVRRTQEAAKYHARPDVSTAYTVANIIQNDEPYIDKIGNVPPAEWETILAKLQGDL